MVSFTCALCICLAVCSAAPGENNEGKAGLEIVDKNYVVDFMINMAANMASLTEKVKQVQDVVDKSRHTEMDLGILRTKVICLEKEMKIRARYSELRVSDVKKSLENVNARVSKLQEEVAESREPVSKLPGKLSTLESTIVHLEESTIAQVLILEQNLSDVREAVNSLPDRVTKLELELFDIQTSGNSSLSALGTWVTSLEDEIPAAFQAIRSEMANISTVSKLASNVTILQQALNYLPNRVTKLESELLDIETLANSSLSALGTRVTSLEDEMPAAFQAIRSNMANISTVSKLASNVTILQETVNYLPNRVTKSELELFDIRTSAKSSLSALGTRVTRLEDEMPAAFRAIRSNMANISTVSNLEQKLAKVGETVNTLPDRVTRFASELFDIQTSANSSLSALGTRIASLEDEMPAIRSEMANISTVSNLERNVIQVQAAIDKLPARLAILETNISNVQETASDRISSLESEMPAAFQTIRSKMANISTNLAQLNTEVGFEVWLSSSSASVVVSDDSILKFKSIQYNIGEGYDSSTGVFTAPESGTYLFLTQVYKMRGSHIDLAIFKSETRIGFCRSATTRLGTETVVAAAHARVGEQVYVKIYRTDRVYGWHQSRFGGTLLHRH